jgi:hypothetical protein
VTLLFFCFGPRRSVALLLSESSVAVLALPRHSVTLLFFGSFYCLGSPFVPSRCKDLTCLLLFWLLVPLRCTTFESFLLFWLPRRTVTLLIFESLFAALVPPSSRYAAGFCVVSCCFGSPLRAGTLYTFLCGFSMFWLHLHTHTFTHFFESLLLFWFPVVPLRCIVLDSFWICPRFFSSPLQLLPRSHRPPSSQEHQ